MNSRYSHPPAYNYTPHSSGPPPPPWQADPNRHTGWGDSRPQGTSSPPYQSTSFQTPVPNQSTQFPPPPPQYGQGRGVPVYPPAQQYNTSQWGVRYNQNQYQQPSVPSYPQHEEQRPPLPARPASAVAYTAPQNSSAENWQYSTPTQQSFSQGSWGTPQGQQHHEKPPIPPPRPSAYAMPTQYLHNEDAYQQHPPTHRYDPPAQLAWEPTQQCYQQVAPATTQHYKPSTQAWEQESHPADGTVSPLEDGHRRSSIASRSHTVSPMPVYQQTASPLDAKVGATALGSGQPSDWQHYYASDSYDNSREGSEHGTAQSQTRVDSPDPMNTQLVLSDEHHFMPPAKIPPVDHTLQSQPPSKQAESPYGVIRRESSSASIPRRERNQGQRPGSTSTTSSFSGIHRTGTIDSVIQAWNTPLKVAESRHVASSQSVDAATTTDEIATPIMKVETIDAQSQTDFPPQIKTETKVEIRHETKEVEIDPYRDLQEGYGATLKRFAGMLRQEAIAETDDEKFKIFQGFVIHELRLRSVLYGIESQYSEPTNKSKQDQRLRKSLDHTAQEKSRDQGYTSQPEPITQTSLNLSPLNAQDSSTPGSKDDSFVVIDAEDAEDHNYSPGGRPRITPTKPKPPNLDTSSSAADKSKSVLSLDTVQNNPALLPDADASMLSKDYVMPGRSSPSAEAPIVVSLEENEQLQPLPSLTSAALAGPLNFQPSRPVYTPFRYNEGPGSAPVIKIERPTEDYGSLRQTQAAESGRMLVQDTAPSSPLKVTDRGHTQSPSIVRREHEEAFIGLIRQKSQAIRTKSTKNVEAPAQLRAGTPFPRSTDSPAPVISPLTKTVKSLAQLVPKSPLDVTAKAQHSKLESITLELSKIRDEFGFIHATVVSWDKANRGIRQRLEAARAARQSENEDRVDQLFHDNEIGYADIAKLEAGFKLDEAGKKYQEDKLELESFGRDVFEVVVHRLESELAQLGKLQVLARDLLDLGSMSAGIQIQASITAQVSITDKPYAAQVMDVMLQLFNKIEIRQQKVAEANFERERRRKRLELSVLYTNGDTAAVKKLERDFNSAEIIQIVEEARKKNERANKLMDSFDRAVVRGLAENQAWIDDVLPKLQLLRDLVLGSEDNVPKDATERNELFYGADGVKNLMTATQSVIDYVLADSQSLVKLSHSADKILNEADFGMYLAEEKIGSSDASKFEKLKLDKTKEDEKIAEEFEVRMQGVTRGPDEGMTLIREVSGRVGNDSSHKERIEKALQEAKKRNAGGAAGDMNG